MAFVDDFNVFKQAFIFLITLALGSLQPIVEPATTATENSTKC
jgi:hypothetical protein